MNNINKENSNSEIEYIIKEYKRLGILDKNSNKIKNIFDFNIYPDEVNNFPICRVCKNVFENCKNINDENNTIESPHLNCGCLWWKFFEEKIVKFYPNVKIVRNKKPTVK